MYKQNIAIKSKTNAEINRIPKSSNFKLLSKYFLTNYYRLDQTCIISACFVSKALSIFTIPESVTF